MHATSLDPSRLLVAALAADATASAVFVAAHVGLEPLAAWTGLPKPLLVGTGFLMAAWVVLLAWMSRAATLPARLVRGVAMGNLGWAAAAAALALAAPYPITTPGLVFLSMHALGTAALGVWQFAGLFRSRPARTPARAMNGHTP
jgi:hypothetical protein